MSLINQVLQNVEARQGSATLSQEADSAWGGAQVKPVLSQASGSTWRTRIVWWLLLLVIAWGAWSQGPAMQSRWQAWRQPAITPVTLPVIAKKPVTLTPPVANAATAQPPSVQQVPQLTRSLFSAWQPDPPVAARQPSRAIASAAAHTHTPSAAAPVVATTAAPQVEGEFTMKATAAAVTPTPVTPVANKTAKSASEDGEAGGVVSKQMRPEQEANVLIQRAVDHEQKGRLNEALLVLRQALVSYPQSEDARLLLAAYLFESKQDQEAVSVLQAGLKQFPAQFGLGKSLAKWQLAHGQSEAVLQTLKPLASSLAQDAESQWMLAMAYQQTGQHAAALPCFDRANALRPGAAQWLVSYAISLQAAGQNAPALQVLQQAQSLPMSERLLEFVSQRIRQLGGNPTQIRNE